MTAKVPHEALVVIADGESARFFRNTAKDGTLALKADGTLHPTNLDGEGPSGKMSRTTPKHETDEATFIKQLATDLYRRAHKGDYTALVLVADKHSLGQIRPLLHKEVQSRIVAEHGKALTKSTIEDIQKSLA